ncbi:hypothetical protein PSTT_06945, partial [Puccinia striiformis]
SAGVYPIRLFPNHSFNDCLITKSVSYKFRRLLKLPELYHPAAVNCDHPLLTKTTSNLFICPKPHQNPFVGPMAQIVASY